MWITDIAFRDREFINLLPVFRVVTLHDENARGGEQHVSARAGAEGQVVFPFEFDHIGKGIVFAVIENLTHFCYFDFREFAVLTGVERGRG